MKKIFLLSASVGLLAACSNLRTEIDPAVLFGEPEKLVVYGYLCPQDTILSVRVGRSKPVVGDGAEALPFNITNATVSLSSGTQTVALPYHSGDQMYRVRAVSMPIRAGQTYTLTVSTPDGKRVRAQASIPAPIAIQAIRLDSSLAEVGETWRKIYLMTISWQDPAGQENYYRYGGTFDWNPIVSGNGQAAVNPAALRQIAFQRESTTGNLLSDLNHDGTVLNSESSAEIVNVSVPGSVTDPRGQVARVRLTSVYPGARFTAQLLHLDKLYYRYASAVLNQRRNRDNPFAEPVLIPTNVEGGLGCFVGYNRTSRTLTVR